MDVEEKNSFRKVGRGRYMNAETKMRLYYFPDISNRSSVYSEEGVSIDGNFRRLDFAPNGKRPESITERAIGKHNSDVIIGVNPRNAVEENRTTEDNSYSDGFTKGQRDGIRTAEKKIEPVLNNFQQAVLELEEVTRKISLNGERESINLALAIAEKIVGHEVATNKNVVLNVVKEALKGVVDSERIKIRISPSDFKVIKDADLQFSKYIDNVEAVSFEKDEAIGNGGCVIETNLGEIDARIEKQLEAVEQALKLEFQESESRDIVN